MFSKISNAVQNISVLTHLHKHIQSGGLLRKGCEELAVGDGSAEAHCLCWRSSRFEDLDYMLLNFPAEGLLHTFTYRLLSVRPLSALLPSSPGCFLILSQSGKWNPVPWFYFDPRAINELKIFVFVDHSSVFGCLSLPCSVTVLTFYGVMGPA